MAIPNLTLTAILKQEDYTTNEIMQGLDPVSVSSIQGLLSPLW